MIWYHLQQHTKVQLISFINKNLSKRTSNNLFYVRMVYSSLHENAIMSSSSTQRYDSCKQYPNTGNYDLLVITYFWRTLKWKILPLDSTSFDPQVHVTRNVIILMVISYWINLKKLFSFRIIVHIIYMCRISFNYSGLPVEILGGSLDSNS